MAGYFTMPYAYLTDNSLADDFWTIRLIGTAPAAPKPGTSGRASKLGPHTLTLGAGTGETANFTVNFLKGGDADTITLQLMRNDHSSQPNDMQKTGSNGGTLTFNNVQAEDVFIVSGLALGTCQLTVDITMKRGPKPSYGSGHFFDNLIA
jgi:hypothetical protein